MPEERGQDLPRELGLMREQEGVARRGPAKVALIIGLRDDEPELKRRERGRGRQSVERRGPERTLASVAS